jgi:hypothetical protein
MGPERIQGGAVYSGAFSPLTVAGRITGKTGNPNLTTTGKIALLPTPWSNLHPAQFLPSVASSGSLPGIFFVLCLVPQSLCATGSRAPAYG